MKARLGNPIGYLLLLVALALTSAPFLGGGWSSDDFSHLRRLMAHPTVRQMFTEPDPFGFYRPVAHATLMLDGAVWGFSAVMWRAGNLLVHVTVILLAWAVARRLLTTQAAFLATLAFVLTPKAHTTAIVWPSARPELVMSAFCLITVLAWLRWVETRRPGWLVCAAATYIAAVLSKETAILLPLALWLIPFDEPIRRPRILGALLILVGAVVPIALRIHAGALLPTSSDEHYTWVWSLHRWVRGVENYLPRTLPAVLAMLLLGALPAYVALRRQKGQSRLWTPLVSRSLLFAVAWFFAFIGPVLLVVARSELYLYLTGFGFCLFAGLVTGQVLSVLNKKAFTAAVVSILIAGLGGYQVVRAFEAHQVFRFTDALVRALHDDSTVSNLRGDFVLVPADATSEMLMRQGVWGYINDVLLLSLGRSGTYAVVAYADQTQPQKGLRIRFAYDDGHVTLSPPN